MHVEQVHFDEVFDTQPLRGDFSFKSRGRIQYGVNLRSGVIPRDGATWAVAFAEPGDWSTVIGWRNLALPAVTLRQSTWSYVFSEMSMIFLLGPAFIAAGLGFGGPGTALVVSAIVAILVGSGVYRVAARNRRVRQALLAVEDSAIPGVGCNNLV